MSCPIHIWVPLMAAAVPVGRVVRDRVRNASLRRQHDKTPPAPSSNVSKWPAIGARPVDDGPSPSA